MMIQPSTETSRLLRQGRNGVVVHPPRRFSTTMDFQEVVELVVFEGLAQQPPGWARLRRLLSESQSLRIQAEISIARRTPFE